MTERQFWLKLPGLIISRATGETALGDFGYYVDWIGPKRYRLGPPCGHIVGDVGFLNGFSCRLDLFFQTSADSTDDIDWSALLHAIDSEGDIRCEDDRLIIDCTSESELPLD